MSKTSTVRREKDTGAKKSELTRQRILDAAAKVFRARGYSGTRLIDIANVAKMKTGSLYYHFDSRERLVAEIMAIGLAQTVDAFRARLAQLPPKASFENRLRCAVETHILQLIDPSDFPAAMLKVVREVPPELRRVHLVGERAYGNMWRDLLEAAARAGELRRSADVSVIRMLIFGAMNWSVEWYRPGAGTPVAVARQCSDFVLGGIMREFGTRPH